jgi:mono/diheme cytochrome c family protein
MAAHVRSPGDERSLCALVSLACLVFPGCGSGRADDAGARQTPGYRFITETGLYAGAGELALAPQARAFEPRFRLWSDAADKARWIALPEGSSIDTTDMERWIFPLGTKVWKEFSRDGVRLETRLIERYGPGSDDYWMGAFVWNDEQSEAELVELGQSDLLGTAHDAPSQEDCGACHNGEPGRLLGFSALQLSQDGETAGRWTLAELVASDRLSSPPAAEGYRVPGDDVTIAALGYLHANCGNCHNPRGTSWPDTQIVLRLFLDEAVPEETTLFQSIVGQQLDYYRDPSLTMRVVAGQPDQSAVLTRMQRREPRQQMPPLASEQVDPEGVAAVRAWIGALAD